MTYDDVIGNRVLLLPLILYENVLKLKTQKQIEC